MAVYFTAVTMDGYLPASTGIDWLHQLGSVEDTGYDDFTGKWIITIMGATEEIQALQDVESLSVTENYVFTHDRFRPQLNTVSSWGWWTLYQL